MEEQIDPSTLVAQYLDLRVSADGKSRLYFPGTDDAYFGSTLSPSAVGTAEDCMHKWGLQRLDNVPRPENYQAERGTTVHNQLEAWLKHGTGPITKNMAKVLAEFPAPGTCEPEGEFGFVFGRPGHEYVHKGRFDVRQVGVIQDLKTTGDLRWKKTPAQLRADLQANVYALAEMLRSNLDTVVCKWVYAQVPTPIRLDDKGEIDHEASLRAARDPDFEIKRVETTEVTLTRQEVMRTLALFVPTCERMMEAIEEKKRAADLPKDASSCEAYGGCAYKKSGACEVPAGGGLLAILKQEKARDASKTASTTTTEKKMGLLGKFAKKETTAAVQKVVLRDDDVSAVSSLLTVIAPVQAAAPEPSAASAVKGSLAARLASVVGGGPKATAVGAALDAAPTHSVHATGIVGINPADAAPPWTQEQQAAESEKIAAGVKSLKGTDALPEDSITAQTVAAQDAEIEAEKAAKKAAKKPKGIVGATATSPLPEGDAMLAVLTRIADSLEKIAGK
jgi:hypothetical protein